MLQPGKVPAVGSAGREPELGQGRALAWALALGRAGRVAGPVPPVGLALVSGQGLAARAPVCRLRAQSVRLALARTMLDGNWGHEK